MSNLSRFKANLKHYPDPEVGDTIKVGTGRQIWTITAVFDDPRLGYKGSTFLHLVNPQGTRKARCYLHEAKFAW